MKHIRISSMEEEKRKFNGKRLYKLTKWILIIVSVIALILAFLSKSALQENNSTSWFDYCKKTYNDSQSLVNCQFTEIKREQDINETMNKEFEIGILLPLIFFGGTELYKYLFPKDKKIDK